MSASVLLAAAVVLLVAAAVLLVVLHRLRCEVRRVGWQLTRVSAAIDEARRAGRVSPGPRDMPRWPSSSA